MKFFDSFKHVIVLIAAITFLLITVFITMRQVRRLPLSYTIQILDTDGERVILTDLRLDFKRYEVAESYARFYRDMFSQQRYNFRVIGLREGVAV
jgi:hypothetical protein